jgi:hypothetical protein
MKVKTQALDYYRRMLAAQPLEVGDAECCKFVGITPRASRLPCR